MQTFEPSRVHARAVVRLGLRSLGPESLWARPNSCRTDLSHHHQRTHGRITIDRVPALAHPFACVKTRRGTSFAQGTKDSGASASACKRKDRSNQCASRCCHFCRRARACEASGSRAMSAGWAMASCTQPRTSIAIRRKQPTARKLKPWPALANPDAGRGALSVCLKWPVSSPWLTGGSP